MDSMISILLVDDDSACLATTATILRKLKYKVTTVKHESEALCMLSVHRYDLVVADVHILEKNGFQLHRIIKELMLPVVLTSVDDKEELVCSGMANGAARFLVKPFKSDDLRNLWQFSLWWKKFKIPAILLESRIITQDQYDKLMLVDHPSHRRVRRRQNNNNNNNNSAGHIDTSYTATAAVDVPYTPSVSRTRKLVWTSTLHSRFVEAILSIGYHIAVPTTILEAMNVSGVTREQVASHLQKYRMFLQQVLDGKADIKCPDWIDLSHVSRNPDQLLIEQLRGEKANKDLANLIPQQDNNVPLSATSSSSIPNPLASATPFTEATCTSTMNEMLMQEVNEEGLDKFWEKMLDIACRGIDKGNNDEDGANT